MSIVSMLVHDLELGSILVSHISGVVKVPSPAKTLRNMQNLRRVKHVSGSEEFRELSVRL